MREFKFRVWQPITEIMYYDAHVGGYCNEKVNTVPTIHTKDRSWVNVDPYIIMQWTGLQDKNGDKYIYEGDIINSNGELVGNKFENEDLLKEATNFLIEGLCTNDWSNTEQEACRRGCKYAE